MEDIEFKCDNCEQKLLVDEKYAGVSVDCPKCQANVSVPYKFQCPKCSFKSYRDFQSCPRCGQVGPGPLGDKVRKRRKRIRRLSFASAALICAYFLLVFARNQVVRAKKVRIEKKLSIVKDLMTRDEDLKAWQELEKLQQTAHKAKFREEEIKQIMGELSPKIEQIRRQKRVAEEERKRKKARQFEEQQRAKGLIKYEGKWMSPDQIAERYYQEAADYHKRGKELKSMIERFQRLIDEFPNYPYMGDVYQQMAEVVMISKEEKELSGKITELSRKGGFSPPPHLVAERVRTGQSIINLERQKISYLKKALIYYAQPDAKSHGSIESKINWCKINIEIAEEMINIWERILILQK